MEESILPRAGLLSNQWRRALARVVTTKLMVIPVEHQYTVYGDGRNLQNDKHPCNTPLIWALWQSGQT